MLSGSLPRAATAPGRCSLPGGATATVGPRSIAVAAAPSASSSLSSTLSMPSFSLRRRRAFIAAASSSSSSSSSSSPSPSSSSSSSSAAKKKPKRRQSAGPIAYKSQGAVENDTDDIASATEKKTKTANATSASSAPASTSSSKLAPFSWTKQWYPIAVESDLPKDRPIPVMLLGRRLVLWWSGEGENDDDSSPSSSPWSCLDDACSHRLAPLSEGRIDPKCSSGSADGKTCRAISCSYHGFAFGARGDAVSVPQARHDGGREGELRAARSPRARVRSYPTIARDQLVWVWLGGGGSGERAEEEAAAAPLPPGPPDEIRRLMVEAAEDGKEKKKKEKEKLSSSSSPAPLVALITNQQYFRDLPVPYDEMMTNLADQSHVPFAHTGVASNRDSPFANHFTVSAVNAHLKEEEEEEEGKKEERSKHRRFPGVNPVDEVTFDLEWAPDALALAKQNVTIVPPCYIEYSTPLQSEKDLAIASKSETVKEIGLRACLWFYAVPLDERRTRIFNNAVVVAHGLPAWAARLINARPKWVDHLFLQNVLDGDVAYLPQAAANEKLGFFSNSSSLPSSSSKEKGDDDGDREESSKLLDPRGELWARRYFMPANADASVVAWRRWLHGERGRSGWLDVVARGGEGGGRGGNSSGAGIGSARVGASSSVVVASTPASASVPLPPSGLPRSELFDRWNQHTKNCPSCARAMQGARRWKTGMTAAAVVGGFFASSAALLLLLSSAASAASASSEALFDAHTLVGVLLSSSALSTLSLTGARAASTLESWFLFKDYEHWKS